jgi:hypothetical protein
MRLLMLILEVSSSTVLHMFSVLLGFVYARTVFLKDYIYKCISFLPGDGPEMAETIVGNGNIEKLTRSVFVGLYSPKFYGVTPGLVKGHGNV